MNHIKCTVTDRIAEIVIHRPPQNRIGEQMAKELGSSITTIARSDARAVLLRADGPDFSFGGDIVPWPEMESSELRFTFERYMQVFNEFERLPLPVIAAVQGLCFGGGLELAVRADIIFAGETARFGHPEQSLGIVTLLGGIYRIAERAGRAKAAEWAMTSEQVPAATMANWGVVNRVIPDEHLLEEAWAFTQKVATGPTRAYAVHKALLRQWGIGGIAAADESMFDLAMPLFETEDVRTGIPSAVNALNNGMPRPVLHFKGE